jgi:hypothetical protein
VPWTRLGETWKRLLLLSNGKIFQELKADDFVLTMRYWGKRGSQYGFKEQKTIKDYLRDDFLPTREFGRLIFRSHWALEDELTKSDLGDIYGEKVDIVLWEELFPPNLEFPELAEPEAVLWNSLHSPKFFFGFDSSLCVLVGQEHPATKIVWPNYDIYRTFFDLSMSAKIVDESVDSMQKLLNIDLKSNTKAVSINTDGCAIEYFITKNIFWNWKIQLTHERDALTHERDALTHERDALTQERDALTQERDALINSKSWRVTYLFRIVSIKIRSELSQIRP